MREKKVSVWREEREEGAALSVSLPFSKFTNSGK